MHTQIGQAIGAKQVYINSQSTRENIVYSSHEELGRFRRFQPDIEPPIELFNRGLIEHLEGQLTGDFEEADRLAKEVPADELEDFINTLVKMHFDARRPIDTDL